MRTKRCSKCSKDLPVDQFHKATREKSGLRSACKECVRASYGERARQRARDWNASQAEANQSFFRDRARRSRHSLDEAGFAQWQIKHPRCEICGSDGQLQIDHDHTCCPKNKSCALCRRGALCYRCNSGIGYFRDNPNLLLQAASYLEAFKERQQ